MKVDVSDKNEALQRDFTGGDSYERKRANVVEDESSSPKTRVHSLVKLLENMLTLKEHVRTVISRKLAQGIPPKRMGK